MSPKRFNFLSLNENFNILNVPEIVRKALIETFQEEILSRCVTLKIPAQFIREVQIKYLCGVPVQSQQPDVLRDIRRLAISGPLKKFFYDRLCY